MHEYAELVGQGEPPTVHLLDVDETHTLCGLFVGDLPGYPTESVGVSCDGCSIEAGGDAWL